MRIMGLDYGSKTVGVALSDPDRIIASPYETIVRDKENKIRPTLRRLTEIAAEQEIGLVVIGHPLNMDDTRGERAVLAEAFAADLQRRLGGLGREIPVVLWDERLSTMSADEILEEAEIDRGFRKQYIDKIAAALILEDYMKNGMEKEDGR